MKKTILSIILILCQLFLIGCEVTSGMNNEKFVLTAEVLSVNEKIEVNVIDSDYAFGVYHVITSNETQFFDRDGNVIDKSSVNVNDVIEITYGGQVMMSYPPQIVASKIVIKQN